MFIKILKSVQKYLFTKFRQVKDLYRLYPLLIPAVFLPLPVIASLIFIFLPSFSFFIQSENKETNPEKIELLRLVNEQSFYNSQIIKAKTDSIGLTIDLVDSNIVLDLKGVPLRICHLKTFSIQLYNAYQTDSLAVFFNKPFTQKEFWASTAKIPILEKMAPKDTIEAALQLLEPVVPPREDIFVYLQLNKNLLIYMSQTESPSFKGWFSRLLVQIKYYTFYVKHAWRYLYNGEIPGHMNEIEIFLDQEDARVIHRALPRHALITFKIPA